MAVVNTKSALITALDAAGDKQATLGYELNVLEAKVEVAAGDDDGSTFRLFRVPENIVITNLELASDALGTSAAYDVGVYETTANGGAVVDADEFASAVALSSAIAFTRVLEEAVATEIDKLGQPLWQRLGLSAPSGKAYDIVATGNVAGTTAGTIAARLTYYIK